MKEKTISQKEPEDKRELFLEEVQEEEEKFFAKEMVLLKDFY